jgi:alpha-mannosidase
VAASLSLVTYAERDGAAALTPRDDGSAQAGGAYIFRPVSASSAPLRCARIVRGPLLTEARCVAASLSGDATDSGAASGAWASFALRLRTGRGGGGVAPGAPPPHLEVEWTLGPVPASDGVSRSVALRLSTSLATLGVLHTDANGRELQLRRRDARPTWSYNASTEPIAGNFYPITALALIADANGAGGASSAVDGADAAIAVPAALAALPDRACGGASLADGQLELMLHRRLLYDDGRGVDEALNETETLCKGGKGAPKGAPKGSDEGGGVCVTEGLVVRGVLALALAPRPHIAAPARRLQALSERPPLLLFFSASDARALADAPPPLPLRARSLLAAPLPAAVSLLTLAPLPRRGALLRLAHGFEAMPSFASSSERGSPGADASLSRHVSIDLAALFAPPRALATVTELRLSAAAPRDDASFPPAGAACEDLPPLAHDADGAGGSATPAASAALRRCRGGRVRTSKGSSGAADAPSSSSASLSSFWVTLGPMEVRTFRLDFDDDDVALPPDGGAAQTQG